MPFAAPIPSYISIGLGVIGTTISTHSLAILVFKGADVKNWRDVPGILEDLDVYEKDVGSYSATVVKARYTYTFGAANFVGRSVSVMDFKPIIGVVDCSDIEITLREAFKGSRHIRVFVNLNKPHETVLARPNLATPIFAYSITLILGVSILALEFLEPQILEPTRASFGDWVIGACVGLGLYLIALMR